MGSAKSRGLRGNVVTWGREVRGFVDYVGQIYFDVGQFLFCVGQLLFTRRDYFTILQLIV